MTHLSVLPSRSIDVRRTNYWSCLIAAQDNSLTRRAPTGEHTLDSCRGTHTHTHTHQRLSIGIFLRDVVRECMVVDLWPACLPCLLICLFSCLPAWSKNLLLRLACFVSRKEYPDPRITRIASGGGAPCGESKFRFISFE